MSVACPAALPCCPAPPDSSFRRPSQTACPLSYPPRCPLPFPLLLPPRRWRLNQGYLATASIDQLVQLGKMTSLEHRRHNVDPMLLGLLEVGGPGQAGGRAGSSHR